MVPSLDENQFAAWRASLQQLNTSASGSRLWRESRYRFAHRLGDALVGATASGPAITGPALYGVWLSWGLIYVGQTTDAQRRLRDLAIGESHHLANTFPPEIWDRIVVIAWSQLAEADGPVRDLGLKVVGLALEHRLQAEERPLANSARRMSSGGWHAVDLSHSASRGAKAGARVTELYTAVRQLWTLAADSDDPTQVVPILVRCVRPATLL